MEQIRRIHHHLNAASGVVIPFRVSSEPVANRFRPVDLEPEVAADFDVARPVRRSAGCAEYTVLDTGVHAGPGNVVERIEERSLQGKVHLPVYRDHL